MYLGTVRTTDVPKYLSIISLWVSGGDLFSLGVVAAELGSRGSGAVATLDNTRRGTCPPVPIWFNSTYSCICVSTYLPSRSLSPLLSPSLCSPCPRLLVLSSHAIGVFLRLTFVPSNKFCPTVLWLDGKKVGGEKPLSFPIWGWGQDQSAISPDLPPKTK